MADWLSNANEALFLKLVRANDDEANLSEEERALYNYNKSFDTFRGVVEKDPTAFKPLGEKIHSYTRRAAGKGKGKGKETGPVAEDDPDAVVYEVYHSTWDTPGFREYHRRMQLFILLYIEGGSYIQEDEDKWEFVVLYERRPRISKDAQPTDSPSYTYHFAGYSSLYPFWCWPDKTRLRLSQFVILPPYQHAGHGSALYGAIYQLALAREDVVELTVEDPSEAFEDLRDRNDLKMLLSLEEFMRQGEGASGKLGPPMDKQWAEKWRKDLKIASRQFHRLIEMLILRRLDPSAKQAQKAFRLQASQT
ncbi:histone acetyltransferase 1 [Ceratobasidium sp. 370]|nr:histone acetyltransferase 1 [Ceratobasidium sp. 370]